MDSDIDGYSVRPPPAALAGFVRCLWRHSSSDANRRLEPIIPDGCPELIFNLGTAYTELSGDGATRVQPSALFAGQLTKPLTLVAEGPVETIGVRFEPDGAREFVRKPMYMLTDKRISLADLGAVDAAALLGDLAAAPVEARQSSILSFVAFRIGGACKDETVAAAVHRIGEGGAFEAQGVSLRQLQRRFLDRVGVSMREFQSICRFRRVFDAIDSSPGWARSALEAGYFDQAQMARDFRRYLGCTASEWARLKSGLAVEIAREASQSYKPRGPAYAKPVS